MSLMSEVEVKLEEFEVNDQQWEITDTILPKNVESVAFEKWPNGNKNQVYDFLTNDQARRHISGWAMRNTNNHNREILKKSCLGVILCERGCQSKDGKTLTLRPAICDKARKKQTISKCPNCHGNVILQSCKGNSGYPITHLWRQDHGKIFFQSKGIHDHPRPDMRPHRECRRKLPKNEQCFEDIDNQTYSNKSEKQDICPNCYQYFCQCQGTFDCIRNQMVLPEESPNLFGPAHYPFVPQYHIPQPLSSHTQQTHPLTYSASLGHNFARTNKPEMKAGNLEYPFHCQIDPLQINGGFYGFPNQDYLSRGSHDLRSQRDPRAPYGHQWPPYLPQSLLFSKYKQPMQYS